MVNTLSRNHFTLVTLGRMRLLGSAGEEEESLTKRRLKLALLALLAVSRRAIPREVLVDTFWGDQDEENARHSLSDALSHLRRVLGKDAIAGRAAEIRLKDDAPLTVDALELATAGGRADHIRVVELYHGPFLDGVHVERSARFEDWVTKERERLRRLFTASAGPACEIFASRGDIERWRATAERWVDASPTDPAAAAAWLAGLAAPGTRDALQGAITGFDRWTARVTREHAGPPDPVLVAQVAEYRKALPTAGDRPLPAPAAARPPRRAWRWAAATVLTGLAAAALLWRRSAAVSGHPVVAVMALRNVQGDSASAWLEDGLQQMLIADLSRGGTAGGAALDVVDPSLLRDAARRQGVEREADLTTSEAVDLGRGLGATWIVTGGVSHGEGSYVVDITLRRATDGAALQVYSVSGTDVLTVADRAAARILFAAEAGAQGPHLADIETGNVEAYQHFIRSLQAEQEGRPNDVTRELDAAITLDPGFVDALVSRIRAADAAGDTATVNRLAPFLARAGNRVSEWDRLDLAAFEAQHNGEHARAEQLARDLVAHYPRDPRGYDRLSEILSNHGKWAAADSVLERQLALDSLATAAGAGPCVPCSAYGGLASLRITTGDLPGAERAARKWIELQPNLPGPWRDLGTILAFGGKFAAAEEAIQRAVTLSGGDVGFTLRLGAVRLLARDYHGVDSLVSIWSRSRQPDLRSGAFDLAAMAAREQGRYRASNATFARLIAWDSSSQAMRLVMANSLAHLDLRSDALADYRRLDEERVTRERMATRRVSPVQSLTGDVARAYSWLRALEAEAVGGQWPGDSAVTPDTVWLRVVADSIAEVSQRSYYGRDWLLAHHVRGLIALAGHRYEEAVRELQTARWGAVGWTATERALAQAYLGLGRTDSALAVLRAAYGGPLDAMGRYEPRSELDYLMAVTFARRGMADSAQAYAGYVRRAWAHADPEIQHRLSTLP